MKTQRIDIRITEDEKQQLIDACQGETLSAFIRRVALEATDPIKKRPSYKLGVEAAERGVKAEDAWKKSRSMEWCSKHKGSRKMTCGCS